MTKIKQNKVLVQIGTNNGDDAFNKIVRFAHPSKVILVEPNASLNDKIRENYKGVSVIIENVAITETDKGLVKIVKPKNIITSTGKYYKGLNYTDVHYSLIPMDDWGNNFDEMEVPSMSFMSLCAKYNLTDIHYLQIDTEGYDAEIIKSIDFDKVNIDMIQYERWYFSEDCFTRHGEKGKEYGTNGMNYISELLDSRGYALIRQRENILALK